MGAAVCKIRRKSEEGFCEEHRRPMCTCAVVRTLLVEKHRTPLSARTRKAAQDFLFSLTYYRKQPRTTIGRINFGLYLATFEVCPVFCCPPCPGSIIHKLAFNPPPKPTYNLVQFGRAEVGTPDYRLELKPAASVFNRFLYRRCQAYTTQFHCFYLGGRDSMDRIACAFARGFSPSPTSRPLTLLYSHSNGMDIGYCAGYLAFLARRLRVDVLCWDYPGYGRSGGPCSEHRLYNAIERVYEFLTGELKVPWQQIVAMGTSLGTAASLHLVATANRPVRGVILQGGFMSALRVLFPKRHKTGRLDQFVNIEKITRVHVPTLVVHGRKDGLFNIVHAEALHKQCPGAAKIRPLFIKEGQHVDFEDYLSYWRRLHTFLHTELTAATGADRPCCTYHPSELKWRDGEEHAKTASTSSLSTPQTTTATPTPVPTPPSPAFASPLTSKPKTKRVIVCEHCLRLDKVSTSSAVLELKSVKSMSLSGKKSSSLSGKKSVNVSSSR